MTPEQEKSTPSFGASLSPAPRPPMPPLPVVCVPLAVSSSWADVHVLQVMGPNRLRTDKRRGVRPGRKLSRTGEGGQERRPYPEGDRSQGCSRTCKAGSASGRRRPAGSGSGDGVPAGSEHVGEGPTQVLGPLPLPRGPPGPGSAQCGGRCAACHGSYT